MLIINLVSRIRMRWCCAWLSVCVHCRYVLYLMDWNSISKITEIISSRLDRFKEMESQKWVQGYGYVITAIATLRKCECHHYYNKIWHIAGFIVVLCVVNFFCPHTDGRATRSSYFVKCWQHRLCYISVNEPEHQFKSDTVTQVKHALAIYLHGSTGISWPGYVTHLSSRGLSMS